MTEVTQCFILCFSSCRGLVPLHNACSYGHYEVAELLVRHGASVNVADLWKFTPLHEAAAKGKYEICKLLLKVKNSDYYLFQQYLDFQCQRVWYDSDKLNMRYFCSARSRPIQEEPRRQHASGHGERWRHRHPGPAEGRCRPAGRCKERLPGSSAETLLS